MPVLKTTRKAPSFYFGLFALLLMISIYLSFQVKSMLRQILSKRYADQDWFYVLAHRSNMHFVTDLFSEGITAHFPAAFFQDA